MRSTTLTLLAILVPFGASALTLVDHHASDYRIVIAKDAPKVVRFAADELQHYLEEIAGAALPIVTDTGASTKHEILLGAPRQLGDAVDLKPLGREGFTLRTQGDRLIIAANPGRGALYGVYTFLEDHLDCRWLSAKVSLVPKRETITLEDINDTQVPVLEFREVYYGEPIQDHTFGARLKMNGGSGKFKDGRLVTERHVGWATWCHTSFSFVPPETYFKEHPEYYGLVGGKRQAKQLCYTNPEILEIVTKRINELLKSPVDAVPFTNRFIPREGGPVWADDEDVYIDVSQQDHGGACTCENCKAVDDREGSHIGSILTFINQLAERFPDKTISTLSYQHSRTPPKTLRAAPNVSIMLCNIECRRNHPLAESPFRQDKEFVANLERWATLADTLFIWDYSVNFKHLMAPNPNLYIQKPNIQLFVNNKAKGVFSQASREFGGDMPELRNYLISKLLWNPDADVDAVIDEFLQGYYQAAAPAMRKYITRLHEAASKAQEPIGIYDSPPAHTKSYLSVAMLKEYDTIFDEAEAAVADQPELLHRVRSARMAVMYAQLVTRFGSVDDRARILDEFIVLCERNQIKRLSEGGNAPAAFGKRIRSELEKERSAPAEES